jgi:transcriptional regulator with XRE-family HTH domain
VRLTARQISAAMALAGMYQDDLASAAGISRSAVIRVLGGEAVARDATLKNIRQALEARNIEFTADQGVRLRPEGIEILNGRDGLIALMEDIYESCRRGVAGEVILAGAPEDDFVKILGDYDAIYLANMSAVPGLKMRTLIQEGDMNFVSGAYTEYRWVPKEQFQPVPFYAYAEKLAIVAFQADPSPRILMIESKAISEAYRRQFESMWILSKPVPSNNKR